MKIWKRGGHDCDKHNILTHSNVNYTNKKIINTLRNIFTYNGHGYNHNTTNKINKFAIKTVNHNCTSDELRNS